MAQTGFIFMLVLAVSVLAGILVSAHVSFNRLSKRIAKRRAEAAAEEPKLDFEARVQMRP